MRKIFPIILLFLLLSACSKKYALDGGYVYRNYDRTFHDLSTTQDHTELQETVAKIAEKLDLETETDVAAYAWQIQEVLVNLGLITEGYLPIRATFYSNNICKIQLTPNGIIYPDPVGDGVVYLHYENEFIYFCTESGYIIDIISDTAPVDF